MAFYTIIAIWRVCICVFIGATGWAACRSNGWVCEANDEEKTETERQRAARSSCWVHLPRQQYNRFCVFKVVRSHPDPHMHINIHSYRFEKCSIHILFINGSSAGMGAVRMRVQTADKKITVIHYSNPHHSSSINWCLVKQKAAFCYKQIHHYDVLSSNSNMSPLSIILLSPVKSCLVWIGREVCTDQAPFTSENSIKSSKQICQRILMREDDKGSTFSLEEVLWRIMDSYFDQKNDLN